MKDVGVIRYDDKGNVGNKKSDRPESYKIVHPGDIVANSMNLAIGSVGLSKELGVTSAVYLIYDARDDEVSIEYFNYLFRTRSFQKHLALFGRGIMELRESVKHQDIKVQLVPSPPKETQEKIVGSLDEKTAAVDALIEKKKKMIALFEEKRASLITHVVTKGLDPHAKMKDSGIDWIGKVPEEWDVQRFQSYAVQNKQKNNVLREQNLLSLSYGKVIQKDIGDSFGLLPASFSGYQIVHPGNLIFRLTDLQNDKKSLRSALVKQKGIITSAYTGVFLRGDYFKPEYLNYLFRSYDVVKVFYTFGSGVRQSAGFDELKRVLILVPPKETQEKIVGFLDEKTATVDVLIEKIKKQITALNEYKQSLIYHAVTGKIDV